MLILRVIFINDEIHQRISVSLLHIIIKFHHQEGGQYSVWVHSGHIYIYMRIMLVRKDSELGSWSSLWTAVASLLLAANSIRLFAKEVAGGSGRKIMWGDYYRLACNHIPPEDLGWESLPGDVKVWALERRTELLVNDLLSRSPPPPLQQPPGNSGGGSGPSPPGDGSEGKEIGAAACPCHVATNNFPPSPVSSVSMLGGTEKSSLWIWSRNLAGYKHLLAIVSAWHDFLKTTTALSV